MIEKISALLKLMGYAKLTDDMWVNNTIDRFVIIDADDAPHIFEHRARQFHSEREYDGGEDSHNDYYWYHINTDTRYWSYEATDLAFVIGALCGGDFDKITLWRDGCVYTPMPSDSQWYIRETISDIVDEVYLKRCDTYKSPYLLVQLRNRLKINDIHIYSFNGSWDDTDKKIYLSDANDIVFTTFAYWQNGEFLEDFRILPDGVVIRKQKEA